MFDVLKVLNLQIFFLSALLFFIGYALAPTAYYKNIKWLTAYPFLIIKLMDRYFKQDWHPVKIFMVIFVLNSLSLFLNLLSGWGVILPCLFMVYMGINIGVVMYHSLEGQFYYASLFNPVSLLELPAAWISITMAIQFALTNYFELSSIDAFSFTHYVSIFLKTVIPLLFFAGIVETILIVFGRNKKTGSD
jgi:hypothetical protein